MSRGRKPKFYVFYDKDDFVKCFGTGEDLFRDGTFKSKNYAKEMALLNQKTMLKSWHIRLKQIKLGATW